MTATIHLPSELLTLERHESYAHERFAYSALRIATEALRVAQLPETVSVGFDGSEPCSFNASVRPCAPAGIVTGFEIQTTELTPAIILSACHHFGPGLFDEGTLGEWLKNVEIFRKHVGDYGRNVSEAIAEYRRAGLVCCLRKLYAALGLDFRTLPDSIDNFDLCTQFIVNHEAAHAYTGQLTKRLGPLGDDDRRALEYVSDLLATEWLYNHIVRNTPDTQEYRDFRGFEDHSESISSNTWSGVQSQILVLLVMGLASAFQGDGLVSLEGGTTHPHGLMRYHLQQAHFMTLVLSNQKSHMSDDAAEAIDSNWSACLSLFVQSGLISTNDLEAALQAKRFEDLTRAADLIEQYDVRELAKLAPLLRTLNESVPDVARCYRQLD